MRSTPNIMHDITSLNETVKENGVKLPPKIKEYLDSNLRIILDKQHNNEDIIEEDVEFVKKIEFYCKLPKDVRDKIGSIEEMIEVIFKPIIKTIKTRFGSSNNKELKESINFADVEKSLLSFTEKLFSLIKLEETGGEPQLVGIEGDEYIFEDRSIESPGGRRDLDFDQALAQANEFGVEMQTPESYKAMQETGIYDSTSYNWLKIDPEYRSRTGHAVRGSRDEGVVYVVKGVAEYPFRTLGGVPR